MDQRLLHNRKNKSFHYRDSIVPSFLDSSDGMDAISAFLFQAPPTANQFDYPYINPISVCLSVYLNCRRLGLHTHTLKAVAATQSQLSASVYVCPRSYLGLKTQSWPPASPQIASRPCPSTRAHLIPFFRSYLLCKTKTNEFVGLIMYCGLMMSRKWPAHTTRPRQVWTILFHWR